MRKHVLALAAVVVFFAVPAFAKFGVRPGWTKAYVNSASRPQVESLVAATNSELLWIYPTKALVYTPRLQTLQTKAIEMGMSASQAKDIPDTFEVNGVTVDPRNDVPAEDDFREYSSKLGLYILQFAGNWDPAMATELSALGVTVVATTASNNAAIVQASLGDVRKTDQLPWLAHRDLLHPRFKGTRRHVDPDLYYGAKFTVALTAPDANRIAQQLALPSHAGTSNNFNFQGADVRVLFEHPLVSSVTLTDSLVGIRGTLPGHGPSGSQIVLNVVDALQIDEVRFNGVRAEFTRIDFDRIRATVPGLPHGPADIMVLRADGWRQVLPSRENYGFRVTERLGESTFARGDLLISLAADESINGPLFYRLEWFTPYSELRRTRGVAMIDRQLFFSADGFLFGTTFDTPRRYDAHLDDAGRGADVLKNVNVVTTDRDGRAFILANGELRRHAPNGDLQEKIPYAVARTIDLSADQCTLVVAGAHGLELFDGCRMQSMGLAMVGSWTVARFLPDGTILAGRDDGTLFRVTTGGGILATTFAGNNLRFAIAPDGNFVWVAHDGQIDRFDLTTQLLTETPLAWESTVIQTFTVYGEWTAGRGDAAYDDDIIVDEVQGFDLPAGSPVTISGRGWLPGAQVTIGGVAVTNANVGTTRITFVMPAGAKSSREVIIRNPNGQRGAFTVPAKVKSKRRAV